MQANDVNDAVSALDSVCGIEDMVTGVAEALRIKGCGTPERDELCLMLSEVAYRQVEELEALRTWLESTGNATQDTPEGQTMP